MPTTRQLRANRANAQRSSGPASVEGKARSSWNALKSGIHAESEVLPWEDPAERETLRAEYHDHHQPCSPEERSMVDNLVHGEFLSRRFRRAEVHLVKANLPAGADLSDDATIGQAYTGAGVELSRLQRRMDANNRAFHRSLDELRLLKAERPPFEPPPPLVLVPPQQHHDCDPPVAQPDPPPDAPPAESAAEPPPADFPAPPAGPPEPAAATIPADAVPPAAQPLYVVTTGLGTLVGKLSERLNPTQIACFSVQRAADVYRFRNNLPNPGRGYSSATLSTPQSTETKSQTSQLASFRKNPATDPETPAETPGNSA